MRPSGGRIKLPWVASLAGPGRRSDMRTLVPALVVAMVATGVIGVGSATATTGAPPSPAGYQPPPVAWGPCGDLLPDFGEECGYLTVPLDYSKPKGSTIQLALSRLIHTVPDTEYQ